MPRAVLPHRRQSYRFALDWGAHKFDVTVSLLDSGEAAEVFLSSNKVGSDIQALARDGAILVSLALQHGCELDVMANAVTRDEQGKPSSLIGALIDKIGEEVAWLNSSRAAE